ncbi:aldehyde dehydrogenase family protein [Pseudomonas sp. PB3P13]
MYQSTFIDGSWSSGSGDVWGVVSPVTEEIITTFQLAGPVDASRAVDAASRAYSSWRKTSALVRADFLRAIAERVEVHREKLISVQIQNSGKPHMEAMLDVEAVIGTFRYYADLLGNLPLEEEVSAGLNVPGFKGLIRRDPVGVAALIVPWNFPMVTTAWKLAPALAAGCTVVVKASEYSPIAEIELMAIIEEVGLPAGVVNMIVGRGELVGPTLTSDPRVRKISFTGSDRVGKLILKESAEEVKNVSLELGGKSPIIVFEDANVDEAVELVIAGGFYNAGQMCSATSRLLVQSSIREEFIGKLVERISTLKVGNPFDQEVEMGPLISKDHFSRVSAMVERAKAHGLTPIIGGERLHSAGGRGLFYSPTLIEVQDFSLEIWNREVFGPVLCFTCFEDDDEALSIANDSEYGLAAAIVTSDASRIQRFTEDLEAGYVTVNAPQIVSPNMSWGGYKASSMGRELGPYGLAAFQEVKSVVLSA